MGKFHTELGQRFYSIRISMSDFAMVRINVTITKREVTEAINLNISLKIKH